MSDLTWPTCQPLLTITGYGWWKVVLWLFSRAIFTSILKLSSILLLYAEQLTYFFNITFLSILIPKKVERPKKPLLEAETPLRSVQIVCIQVNCLETRIFGTIELNCSGFRKLLAREWKRVKFGKYCEKYRLTSVNLSTLNFSRHLAMWLREYSINES